MCGVSHASLFHSGQVYWHFLELNDVDIQVITPSPAKEDVQLRPSANGSHMGIGLGKSTTRYSIHR